MTSSAIPPGSAELGRPRGRRHRGGQDRVPQPRRQHQGPHRGQDDRRRRGQRELKPGGTIVEPTSGNTGVGLALVAQRRGYKCVFVCPDKVSEDKQNVLRAYGAEVVVCPTAVPPDHPDSYYSVSDRLVERDRRRLEARPVRQPARPGQPLRDHRPGDLGRHRRQGHPLRRRHRNRRHHHRRRPLPERGVRRGPCASSAPTRKARSIPAAAAGPTWSRVSARTSGRRPTTRRCPTRSSRCRTPTRST